MAQLTDIKKYKDKKLAEKMYNDFKEITLLLYKAKQLMERHKKYKPVAAVIHTIDENAEICVDLAHNLLIYMRGENNENIKEAKNTKTGGGNDVA